MDSEHSSEHWQGLLRSVFDGRRFIVCSDVAAGATGTVAALKALGVADILVVALGRGAGPVPSPDDALVVLHEITARGNVAMIRAFKAMLEDPPASIRDAVEEYDPQRDALVLGPFHSDVPALLGRPFLAHRRPEWVALEDKTKCDALWVRAGVPSVPSRVVTLDLLREEPEEIDVVWAGDSRDGFHGGGEGIRWIRTAESRAAAAVFFRERCDTVRVMPFLEGVPCSIHGIVFPDFVVALRPVEMITLRRPIDHPQSGEFVYSGCASLYDQPSDRREEMRSVARRVGERLRAEVGFRGAFTVDGVMTAVGFRPTELNPRAGAGLNALGGGLDGLPILLLLDLIVAGIDLDWQPAALEELVVAAADRVRGGGTWRGVPIAPEETTRRIAVEGVGARRTARWAAAEEPHDVVLVAGPSGGQGFARLTIVPERFESGESFAPTAVALWALLDRELAVGTGPLLPCIPAAGARSS